MNIVFLTHPSFLGSQSMPRYAHYLLDGMVQRGHTAQLWQPKPRVHGFPAPNSTKKWLGYVDQYVVFPQEVRRRIRHLPDDTLFVLTDHALGPYAPLVAHRPHVIHCHDFLAQRSALGELPENRVSWTGRQYQAFIHQGYTQGRNFISISTVTQHNLHHLLGRAPSLSEIVYNGLLDTFTPAENRAALRQTLQDELSIELSEGFLLHVGGNQWYKNRRGVVWAYEAWRNAAGTSLPLLLVGETPDPPLLDTCRRSPVQRDIHCLTNAPDTLVKRLYQAASLLLFPSLAEGFGWPIIEAMASGCPVITTDEQPMVEVAGGAAVLIPRLTSEQDATAWMAEAAKAIDHILRLTPADHDALITKGLSNVKRFNPNAQLDRIEQLYQKIINVPA